MFVSRSYLSVRYYKCNCGTLCGENNIVFCISLMVIHFIINAQLAVANVPLCNSCIVLGLVVLEDHVIYHVGMR